MIDLMATGNRQPVNGATTPDTWAQSQLSAPAGVPKSKAPLAAVAAVGVLLVAGLGFGAFKLLSLDKGGPSVAAAPASAQAVVATPAAELVKSAPTVEVVPTATPSAQPSVSPATSALVAPGKPNTAAALPPKPLAGQASLKPAAAAAVPGKPGKDKPPATKPKPGPVDFGY
jgi:hypothetical protein